MPDGIVGDLNWDGCESCIHYRADVGGCQPLDDMGEHILQANTQSELVYCERYEEKPVVEAAR